MITKTQIQDFFSHSHIAVIGVSRNKKKFGFLAFKKLQETGINVVPVNPNTDILDGTPCIRQIENLPNEITAAVVLTSKKETLNVLKQLHSKGINNIWIQQESETKDALEFAKSQQLNIIYGKCIFMFAEPVKGIHKFHRSILGFFGKLPK